MNKEKFFKNNLLKMYRDLKNGELIILDSGKEINFSGDTSYRFRVNKNFYYYTGIECDSAYFLVFKMDDIIIKKFFYNFIDEKMVKWVGKKLSVSEIKEKLDINMDMIYGKEALLDEIKKILSSNRIEKIYKDMSNSNCEVDKILYNELGIVEINKTLKYANIDEFSSLHRVYKEAYEIEQIKEAIKLTDGAIRTVMKNIATCTYEYEAEAYYDFYLKKKNIRNKAFESIFASGNNAVTLHYIENAGKLNRKELLLMDVGAEYMNYAADISRTIPIGKKFNEIQKKYYEIVLKTNKMTIDHIEMGMTFKELNEYAKKILADELIKVGLINDMSELDRYYYHSVSHPLGLDAHDLRVETSTIECDMVITVEPGLYIAEEGIGIRIEDDVHITDKGNVVLTDIVPKETIDIENCMKEQIV